MTIPLRRLSTLLALLAACTLLASCQSSAPKDVRPAPAAFLTYRITLLVEKGSNLGNEDPDQELPLKVKVFKLRSATEFMTADFFALQAGGANLLQGQLIGQEQFFLRPGQRMATMSVDASSELDYLGILAEYQQLDGKIWRRTIELPQPAPVRRPFYRFLMPEKQAIQTSDILIRATPKGLHESVGPVRTR